MPEMLDVDAMIADLRAEIESLQNEIQMLERVREIAQSRGYYGDQAKSGGRRDELRIFLRDHGPMKAADIAKRSGIPRGTVDYLLNDRENFRKLGDGTWATRRKYLTAGAPSDETPHVPPPDIGTAAPQTEIAPPEDGPKAPKSLSIRACARSVLRHHGEPLAAATISAALEHEFQKSASVDTVRRTLTKLTGATPPKVFTRTKEGLFGLIEWEPTKKRKQVTRSAT